ncbi:hypothetical protein SUGI_0114090 [Cryptomeria japonica]|nr:hypothetical protein SUGI_0114090 [Cryptomeria japonica]
MTDFTAFRSSEVSLGDYIVQQDISATIPEEVSVSEDPTGRFTIPPLSFTDLYPDLKSISFKAYKSKLVCKVAELQIPVKGMCTETIPLLGNEELRQLHEMAKSSKTAYQYMHISAIRIGLEKKYRDGLPVVAFLALADERHKRTSDALLGVMKSLSQGSCMFDCYPNFSVSLKDPHLNKVLSFKFATDYLQMEKDAISHVVHFRVYYRLFNTTMPFLQKPVIDGQPIGTGHSVTWNTDCSGSKISAPQALHWKDIKLPNQWALDLFTKKSNPDRTSASTSRAYTVEEPYSRSSSFRSAGSSSQRFAAPEIRREVIPPDTTPVCDHQGATIYHHSGTGKCPKCHNVFTVPKCMHPKVQSVDVFGTVRCLNYQYEFRGQIDSHPEPNEKYTLGQKSILGNTAWPVQSCKHANLIEDPLGPIKCPSCLKNFTYVFTSNMLSAVHFEEPEHLKGEDEEEELVIPGGKSSKPGTLPKFADFARYDKAGKYWIQAWPQKVNPVGTESTIETRLMNWTNLCLRHQSLVNLRTLRVAIEVRDEVRYHKATTLEQKDQIAKQIQIDRQIYDEYLKNEISDFKKEFRAFAQRAENWWGHHQTELKRAQLAAEEAKQIAQKIAKATVAIHEDVKTIAQRIDINSASLDTLHTRIGNLEIHGTDSNTQIQEVANKVDNILHSPFAEGTSAPTTTRRFPLGETSAERLDREIRKKVFLEPDPNQRWDSRRDQFVPKSSSMAKTQESGSANQPGPDPYLSNVKS